MEKLKNSTFKELVFPENCELELRDKTLYVTKWEWEFLDCLNFQKQAQQIIQKNRDHKVYIFCNHPHCFTLGRGNERDQDQLVEFDESQVANLVYPVHKIHRGGGITFHFPGQWIFYPIMNINQKYTLDDHMCWLLKSVKEILSKNFGLEKTMAAKKLMGVWIERQKLASIGVGLSRFVTEHGLALNLIYDPKMFNELKKINPCGINPTTYTAVNKLKTDEFKDLIQEFHLKYLENL